MGELMGIFKSHIEAMTAYQPPLEGRNPNDFTLLDFNERTIPISKPIKDALVDYINSDRLQQYPHYGDINERLASYVSVEPEQVMITNGSDQGIDLIIRAACSKGDSIIIPGPSFAMYAQVAKVEALDIVSPQYSKEGGYPLAAVLNAITDKTKTIIVSNPNNPSGTLVEVKDILTLAAAAPEAVILVDECYFEYNKVTVAPYLVQYPNIVITRTFSKTWGLPSLRFGYVLASTQSIQALLNVRGPYDINQLAVVAAHAALENPQYTQDYVAEVMSRSKPLLEKYFDGNDIEYWPSAANYLWAFPQNPQELNERLNAAGILVRPKADQDGRIGLRITLGTVEQTEALISVLRGD